MSLIFKSLVLKELMSVCKIVWNRDMTVSKWD
jgi:hypothetical protein